MKYPCFAGTLDMEWPIRIDHYDLSPVGNVHYFAKIIPAILSMQKLVKPWLMSEEFVRKRLETKLSYR